MGEFHAGWSLGTIRRHGPGEVLAMGSCWDVPPTLGHSFPAPARSPPLLPPPLPFPPPLPLPPAALLWAPPPSFRLASSRSVSCRRASWSACRCPCSPRVLFLSRFVSPRWPSFLYWLLPGATSIYLHITKSVSGVALRGPPGGDEIAQRALSIFKMSATSPTGAARAGGVYPRHHF